MSDKNIEEAQNENSQKHKIITGFIHFNENDEQSKLFEDLNVCRKNWSLKYTHQKNIVFFTLNSEHLGEFAKIRPFKISRFQSKSSFKCDKDVADKLMSQRDSFLRMSWDEEENTLLFFSRTTSRVHGNLVRRVFKDSEQTFVRDNYTFQIDEEGDEINVQEDKRHNDGFTKVKSRFTVRKERDDAGDKQMVRGDKPFVRGDKPFVHGDKPKVFRENTNKPMIRGTKATK
jgi:hypothetical protein